MRRWVGPISGLAVAALSMAPPAYGIDLVETPMLGKLVADGKLPPVAQRVPVRPDIAKFDGKNTRFGRLGGDLRILMARAKDTRIMVVYGYARLVGYNDKLELKPDILERYEVKENRIFTFRLRKGHKWSDGHPFTSEDFRHYWEDVANNQKLSKYGLPQALLVDGKKAKFEVIDKHTVRYTWDKPNPYFLAALCGASPLYIYRPAHYLKRFHEKYAKPKKLKKWNKKRGGWVRVYLKKARQYRNENPDLPILQPWVLKTRNRSAERFLFERNPYYHRIDERGRQLPYIDRVIMIIAGSKIIPAKTGAGETDVQARYIRFNDYTFLKKGEQRNNYSVRLWNTATGSHLALYPNLNANDPEIGKLMRDVRFRRALSLAINRREINEILYYGLAVPGANTVVKESPLFRAKYRTAWTRFDLAKANELLDEVGLLKRGSNGIRLLPDGRPLELVVESTAEGTEMSDAMSLIKDSWKKIGVKLFPKATRRENFRRRVYAGATHISMWAGLDKALVTAQMSPEELAPTRQIQLQWPDWGLNVESRGKRGQEPDDPAAQELLRLKLQWDHATEDAERRRIWHRMLEIYSDQVYTIGIVSGVLQPVVVSNRLHNVPQKGIYAWDPGSHFGIYRPDTWWLSPPAAKTRN